MTVCVRMCALCTSLYVYACVCVCVFLCVCVCFAICMGLIERCVYQWSGRCIIGINSRPMAAAAISTHTSQSNVPPACRPHVRLPILTCGSLYLSLYVTLPIIVCPSLSCSLSLPLHISLSSAACQSPFLCLFVSQLAFFSSPHSVYLSPKRLPTQVLAGPPPPRH